MIAKLCAELGEFRDEQIKAFKSLQTDVLGQVGVALGRGAPRFDIARDDRTAHGGDRQASVLKRFVASSKKPQTRGNQDG